jgi:cell fate regulator YaaT (PSP1 superfamily)
MYSTTFQQIVSLADEYIAITSHSEWTDEERWRAVEIRAELAKLYPRRRIEQALARVGGAPQILGTYGPRDRERIRGVAHSIAPLPRGGD